MTTMIMALYPFDPTGTATTNLIQNEQQVLKPPATNGNWSDYFFIVPLTAPYFADSLVMTLQSSGKILVEGVDYICTHRFHDASLQCASPVYGSISFMDKTLSGIAQMSYQTVGGDWTINNTQIAQILANTLLDPRSTTWEQVVSVPYQFPPVSHQWNVVDMTGASDIVTALNAIVTAIQSSGDQGLANHLADYLNPHRVTSSQVGLGSVSNYAMASNSDGVTGTSSNLYMSPASTTAAIDAIAVAPLTTHVNSQSNPHNVTATQVGLGAVNNYGWATTTDAQNGVTVTGYMNAALTASAITAQALTPLNTHIANQANPHNVTALQVGLGNVPNDPMATLNEALAGTADNRLMSPSLVAAVMQNNYGGSLSAHLNDFNNPHQVTALQVGLNLVQDYGIATNAQALAGTATNAYMTPALTMAAIQDEFTPFVNHIANRANPHVVDATQVGLGAVNNYGWAAIAEATAGSATNGYMNASLTSAAIASQVGNAFTAHVANLANPHQVTAAQLGVYTTAQVDSSIATLTANKLDKTAQAADSALLEGKTIQQVINAVALGLPAAARYSYPAVNPGVDANSNPINTGVTWTVLADVLAFTPDVKYPLPPMNFVLTGGEARDDREAPVYYVSIDPRFPKNYRCEQLAGYPNVIKVGYITDPAKNTFQLLIKSPVLRNAVTLAVLSDPGNAFSSATTVFDAAPTGIIYLTPVDRGIRDLTGQHLPGQQVYGAPVSYGPALPSQVTDTYIQNINVLEPGESTTAAQGATVNWTQAIPHFMRVGAAGNEAARAGDRRGWIWNNTNAKVVRNGAEATVLHSLVSNQPATGGGYQMEILVESTDLADMAIGVVAAYTDRNGEVQALHAMRDLGGVSYAAANGGILGENFYKLFTVGYNLFQDDAIDLGSTSAGLTWGDGVADSARGSTAYVPEATTTGTNGWNGKGAVAIRITVAPTGGTNGYPSIMFETSNVGAVVGSITYVAAATVSIDLGAITDPDIKAIADAMISEGVRWGFSCYQQPVSEYTISESPDKYVRYVAQAVNADGTDNSLMYSYTGTGWVSHALVGGYADKPNRMYVSNINQRLYQTAQDGSVQPIYVLGYNGTGRDILTT